MLPICILTQISSKFYFVQIESQWPKVYGETREHPTISITIPVPVQDGSPDKHKKL